MEVREVRYQVKVNKAWCKACGICVEFCPKGVLALGQDGKVDVVNQSECTGCGLCELRCPDFALEVGGVENE
ncbi:MAG TPA: 4Fe-4S binding protein [Firmicutes bacterium]|nr:4Fe-4S binding protein [Bacillota bacterium]